MTLYVRLVLKLVLSIDLNCLHNCCQFLVPLVLFVF